MEKEELLSLIDKKVSKQGNQGATELGSILGSVVEYLEEKTGPKCLKFTSINGDGMGFIISNDGYEIPEEYVKPNIEYSLDNGNTWEPYELVISDDPANANLVTPDEGESVLFRGINNNLAYYLEDEGDYLYMQCYMEGLFSADGDVTSLLNGVGGDVPLEKSCYQNMFSDCTGLTSAPALPSTTLASGCYASMFQGCTGLTSAPALPATTLAEGCYQGMFSGCTDLTSAPALPATTLADNCYQSMFSGCTSLTSAPALPVTTLADGCYEGMFYGCTGLTTAPTLPATTLVLRCYSNMFSNCTGLTTAPALPATTLAKKCYMYMFQGCTGLIIVPALPATTLAEDCYDSMFRDCSDILSHHFATMNISTNVFNENNSCASFTIDDVTPPVIANNTIAGLKADCIIYVPAGSVDAYKAARYWDARASYIQAKP